jgi:hypothetical protein
MEVKEQKELVKEVKEFKEERFEFALYVNNNVICKRNFKINNYIDESMQSLDFKQKVDEIVEMINDDLKSKSRVFTWYYGDVADVWQEPLPELLEPLIEPWECTFKFVVSDNKKEVITKIWDGYGFPKSIREKVDIANKTVKITTKDGRIYSYDKDTYFEENKDRLTAEMYVLKAQILDKPDLLLAITKKICEVCSPREDSYKVTSDYILSDIYKDKEYEVLEGGVLKRDKNGKLVSKKGQTNGKKYFYSINMANRKLAADWGKLVAEKTKQYFANLY